MFMLGRKPAKNLVDAFTNFYLHAFNMVDCNIRFFGSATSFPNLLRSRKRFRQSSYLTHGLVLLFEINHWS